MSVTILAVGKKHEDWVASGIQRYEKRLRAPFDVKWEYILHSSFDGDRARQEESQRILQRLPADAHVILLDERGKNISSPELAEHMQAIQGDARRIIFVIGGAFGVDTTVNERADFMWSLSRLVFPHQLVRLILVEQVYRASQIIGGGQYHHQ